MNKLFSKVAALSVGLTLAIGVGVAVSSKSVREVRAEETVNISPSNAGWSSSQVAQEGTEYEGITLSSTKGAYNTQLRIYGADGATFTVACSLGNMTNITYTTTQNDFTGASVGDLSNKVWTGSAASVTFTCSNQVRVSGLSVKYEPSGPITTYTISYDANGGSGEMASTTSSNPAVAECIFTAPIGMVFERWNTASDGTGTDYAAGTKPGKDLELYAIWTMLDHISIVASTTTQLSTAPWSTTANPNSVETESLARGWQWSSGNSAVITYSAEDAFKKVVIGASTNGGSTSLAVSVGGVAFGEAQQVADGTAAAKTEYTFEGTGTGNVVITLTNTASKSAYINQIDIYYDDAPDPSKKDIVIYQGDNPADGGTFLWSSTAGLYSFVAKEESTPVTNVTWGVSNTAIATINSSTGSLTCVRPGSVTIFAEADGYNKASATIEISKSWLEELTLTGSMTKTSYTTLESWNPAGFTVTGTYHSGWEENVTASVEWSYSPTQPADGVTTVVATATLDEKHVSSSAQSVTVTVAHDGSKSNPYTVAEARALIDSEGTINDKYVTGIVSRIVTAYSSQHGNISFNMSDNGSDSNTLQAFRCTGSTYYTIDSADDVEVGATVLVVGNLTKYNSTYEFDAGCKVEEYTAPVVEKVTSIADAYTASIGQPVDFVGQYVGLVGTDKVLMDGEYGILLRGVSDTLTLNSKYRVKSGVIAEFHGQRQVNSAVVETTTAEIAEPVVYAAKGGETFIYANRLTTVTGTAAVISGDFSKDAGTSDIKMNFTVGSNLIQVFYKATAQTADAETFAAMKAAVDNSTEITVKGFTGWYDGFQVQMNGYVPAAVGYTAEDFAQDLLDQTDAVCVYYVDGTSSYSEFKAALTSIWSNLAGNDKYPSLPSDQKTILAEAVRDEEGSTVEQAMARYDFLTGKYDLSNFINGRTPIPHSGGAYMFSEFFGGNNGVLIIIAIASVSALAFTMVLVFKKKKQK